MDYEVVNLERIEETDAEQVHPDSGCASSEQVLGDEFQLKALDNQQYEMPAVCH